LGDYFKQEQLPWVYEFFIEKLKLNPNKLYASVFAGDKDAPKDTESIGIITNIFKKYGIEAKMGERIFEYDKKENWWKRGDAIGELGGPDSEVFYYLGEGNGLGKDPAKYETEFLEIGNSVFMQYKKSKTGWEELPQKNVDFGGGLERLALAVQNKRDIFETDNFWPIIEKIQNISNKKYEDNVQVKQAMRIIADHMRTATFISMDGVLPSNKDQGYLLRRVLRRMVRVGRSIGIERDIAVNLVGTVVDNFKWIYPQLETLQPNIEKLFSEEENKFRKVLIKGATEANKKLNNFKGKENDLGKIAFELYQSLGYPVEMFIEDIKDNLVNTVNVKDVENEFEKLIANHKDLSRSGAEQKFAGGLADQSEQVIKYHTATHLLHWALREVLGKEVSQKGSNITGERLRFDFSYDKKLTQDEIVQVQKMVNNKIKENLPVNFSLMTKEEAIKSGALHFFGEKYGDNVNVYYIGDSLENSFSKEFCGGPHVKSTAEIGDIELFKQKSIGKGLLRVYVRNS
jgi:alanyl-tRNA synthetase